MVSGKNGSEEQMFNDYTQRLYLTQFWIYLLLVTPSIMCLLFALYHFLFDRTLRQALHNHMIIVLLGINRFSRLYRYDMGHFLFSLVQYFINRTHLSSHNSIHRLGILYPFPARCCQKATLCQEHLNILLEITTYRSFDNSIVNMRHFSSNSCILQGNETSPGTGRGLFPPCIKRAPTSKKLFLCVHEQSISGAIIS
jgi:hypothetical protein